VVTKQLTIIHEEAESFEAEEEEEISPELIKHVNETYKILAD
jgi:hypothetical protein